MMHASKVVKVMQLSFIHVFDRRHALPVLQGERRSWDGIMGGPERTLLPLLLLLTGCRTHTSRRSSLPKEKRRMDFLDFGAHIIGFKVPLSPILAQLHSNDYMLHA
jgi:hypothetical protein